MAKSTNPNFVAKVLASLNKTDAEKQQESVTEFMEDSIIDLNAQISNITTSDIPKLQSQLNRAQNNLAKAKKNFDAVRFSIATNLEVYIANREHALDQIDSANNVIANINEQIADKNAELESFQSILADFNS